MARSSLQDGKHEEKALHRPLHSSLWRPVFFLVTSVVLLFCSSGGDLSSIAVDLPVLQTNVGGDASLEWRYANAVLGAEVWLLDSSSDAGTQDRFLAEPSLLTLSLTEGGWPRSLPDGITVTLSPTYRRKVPPKAGEIRSQTYENLTGVYVVTWEGRTIPDSSGFSRLTIHDTINDGNPKIGTTVLMAGGHRAIALVRDPGRGITVSYERPDPSDPIRDIKIWTPLYMGAGLTLDLRYYSESRLGRGKLSDFNTEPAPGAPDPLWHPQYLKHLREDPSGVLRFMGFLEINGLDGRSLSSSPISWNMRKPPSYTIGSLVAISPYNWERHMVPNFRGGTQVPYEWIFNLCQQVGKDAWIQVPHTATDDHITELASLAASCLPRSSRVWFEFSNELWNNYGPYIPQYEAAQAEGKRYRKDQGWGSGHLQAKAIRTFETAWLKAGRSDSELINVVSGFEMSSEYNERVLDGVKALSPDLAEALAITTYFGASLTQELYALPYGRGDPDLSVYEQAGEIIRKDIYDLYEIWKANGRLCRNRGIPMIAYEGGAHILATGYGDWSNPSHAAFMTFLANLHKHPIIAELYLEHWALWTAAGGRTVSLFQDIGGYGYYGYWGAKEDVTENTDQSPRYEAARDFVKKQKGIKPIGAPTGARPKISTPDSFRIEAGKESSLSIRASGGDGSLTYMIFAGLLPPGMVDMPLVGGGILILGPPASPGGYRFIVRVTDQDGDPDYEVVRITVDPRESSGKRLLLFDTESLPVARIERSENREEYRTRFDITASRPSSADIVKEGPRFFIPFNGTVPLFTAHYIDPSITIDPASPFALSGGLSLTLLEDDFYRANPSIDGKPRWPKLSLQNTSTLLWVGFRDRKLSGQIGSSLDLKPDASHAERRYGVPTRFDAIFLWRLDQMENTKRTPASFGPKEDQATLMLESEGIGADQATWRFIIRERGIGGQPQFYISEAHWDGTAEGRFLLSGFNDNSTPGKRWAQFRPNATSFAMPTEGEMTFQAVDFSQVDGVGFALQASRFGWHYDFRISRFLVIGQK